MKPSQLAKRKAQHIAVFGAPKTGKSTLVSQLLLAGFNLTWISLDNGHEVIFKLPLTAEQLDKQLNIVVVPDTKEFPVACKTCEAIVSGKPANICDAHGQVNCSTCMGKKASFTTVDPTSFGPRDILVFDHLGQLSNSWMNRIMSKMKEDDKPEWEHYRMQGTMMDKFLTNIQQATYNVICITHEAEVTQEDKTKKLVPVIGSDNFSRNSGKYFDSIVYLEMYNGRHKFGSRTTYKNSTLTGSRKDIAIEDMKDAPSLEMFFDGSIPDIVAEEEASNTQNRLETIQKAVIDLGAQVSASQVHVTNELEKTEKVSEKIAEEKTETPAPKAAEVINPAAVTKATTPAGMNPAMAAMLAKLRGSK